MSLEESGAKHRARNELSHWSAILGSPDALLHAFTKSVLHSHGLSNVRNHEHGIACEHEGVTIVLKPVSMTLPQKIAISPEELEGPRIH